MKLYFIIVLFSFVIACKSTKNSEPEVIDFSENLIELDLADRLDPKRISTSFSSLGVEYVCTVDKTKNICIYSFDTKQNDLAGMLEFLGNEVGVEGAQKTFGCEN